MREETKPRGVQKVRKLVMFSLCVAVSVASHASCGAGDDGGTGGRGGAGDGSAHGGSAASSSSARGGSNSTGSMGDCSNLIQNPSVCQQCAAAMCCSDLAACMAEDTCAACLTNPNLEDPTVCLDSAEFHELDDCAKASCRLECTSTLRHCNPVTNESCDAAAGEACDLLYSLSTGRLIGFACAAGGNTHALCEPCGSSGDGDYCMPGLTCLEACARFCCDDGDCGSGTCNKELLEDPNVGVCVDAAEQPACDAPAVAPSMGECANG
jgi:hypothetical protein